MISSPQGKFERHLASCRHLSDYLAISDRLFGSCISAHQFNDLDDDSTLTALRFLEATG